MISFRVSGRRFHLRAAAIARRGDEVLLHRVEGDDFWSLPGGRVEAGESAQDAVLRELQEEMGETGSAGALAMVVENFFDHGGESHHEVGLYFPVQLAPGSAALAATGSFEGHEGERRIEFAWFARDSLASLDVRPAFLAQALARDAQPFIHVVHREGDTPAGTA